MWVGGSILTSLFLVHLALAEYNRAQAVSNFSQQIIAANVENANVATSSKYEVPEFDVDGESVNQSLWSAGRIRSFATSSNESPSNILAIFSIPRLDLEVPLYDGASDLHMDLGVARIGGTAMPGHSGNLGIAGHRDGFFRILKDIRFGDDLRLMTADGIKTYKVEQLMIVEPSVVNVLDPTDKDSITLVTCYPFYFVGHAPERFIVRATLHNPG